MPILQLSLHGSDSSLSVRRFSVHEALSSLFTVTVWACSDDPSLNLAAIVGSPASLRILSGQAHIRLSGARLWRGICCHMEQIEVSAEGLSTYCLRIVPVLWLLTQRRNYRIFQHLSVPDIADRLLDEWGVERAWQIDRARYPKLHYKVQYGESDHAFLSRLLEEAGITFAFPDENGEGTMLVLRDEPHGAALRPEGPIRYVDNPNTAAEREYVTKTRLSHEMRPGAYTIRDYDFRNPAFPLFGEAPKVEGPEGHHEQYHYQPGAFLHEVDSGGETFVADGKGAARHEQRFGQERAERALRAARVGRRAVSFETNTPDLWPGTIFAVAHHPHAELSERANLLMTELSLEGSHGEEWHISGKAVFADVPYRPPLVTPKPEVAGVQSATVVGPGDAEIHTDEFGRVRVEFPWDREGRGGDDRSCWLRVSQGWAGTGYGMIVLPRVGQEVLVGFLEGNPDQPIIVGRVFNNTQQVPYRLPEHRTRSTWKSRSSPDGDGFNEIMFEDRTGQELVYVQAEKNLRKLVKNDETITVGHDRRKLVKNDEAEKILGNRKVWVGKDHDIVVIRTKRERVEGSSHLSVHGERRTKVDENDSLIVGKSRHERVGNNHAVAAKQIHTKASTGLVLEAGEDLTVKGPGGFIRIDSSGITIRGQVVRINSGGSPGSGEGSHPKEPEAAIDAETDDVSRTGIGQ